MTGRRLLAALCAAGGALSLLAACGGGATRVDGSGPRIHGGTATMALAPSNSPNYIFPLDDSPHFTTANLEKLQHFLYRPLYWFGDGDSPNVNDRLSLAHPPTYSADGRSVTVRLKDYRWSDGAPVTARDVLFWQRLVTANKDLWGAYVPGAYPDNITRVSTPDARTVVFRTDKVYDRHWFQYNELSQITPLPTHAWDRTSMGGPVGDADRTSKGAVAVYRFLDAEAKKLKSYPTSPLWKVVDGPWRLTAFSPTTGGATFEPNRRYSGPVKPSLDRFEELGFTSDQAETNQVAAGDVDVGYLPFDAIPQEDRFRSRGYDVVDWPDWSVRFFDMNYNSPKHAAEFRQRYVRQALQRVMDQNGAIRAAYGGRAKPSYGPIPNSVRNTFISDYTKQNHFPFDPAAARRQLTEHGWRISGGVAECASVGTGPHQCGTGIAAGARLSFELIYASGDTALEQMMSFYKSNAAKAGIDIQLTSEPFSSVVGAHGRCQPGDANCHWDMINWGGGWGYAPDVYPSGDIIFSSGGGSNRSNYSDRHNDANIVATQLVAKNGSNAALERYQNYLVQQAAVIWEPEPPYQISLIRRNLHGVTPQSPVLGLTPEEWYFTGKAK